MRITLLFISFLSLSLPSFSQENGQTPEVKKIKITKENSFIKAAFDEAEYKVIAFDRFGNPHESAVKSFVIKYVENKTVFQSTVSGNTFPDKTIAFLTKKKKEATKICLEKIVAEDKDGHLETLPDLCDIVIFPICKKVNNKK